MNFYRLSSKDLEIFKMMKHLLNYQFIEKGQNEFNNKSFWRISSTAEPSSYSELLFASPVLVPSFISAKTVTER